MEVQATILPACGEGNREAVEGLERESAEVSLVIYRAFGATPSTSASPKAQLSPLPRKRGRLGEPDRPKYRTMKRARALRKSMTNAEVILWQHVRRRQVHGFAIRRQHAIGPFIADFASVALKLVIEVDGDTHGPDASAYDARRTRFLEAQGWRVLRVFNRDVYENLEGVMELIGTTLAELDHARTFQCGPSETAKNP